MGWAGRTLSAVSAQVSKNALDVWGLDKESALHKFFVGKRETLQPSTETLNP
jgi:hypothetical protein